MAHDKERCACLACTMERYTDGKAKNEDKIREAITHLGAALMQVLDTDDEVIVGHMRDAHEILKGVWDDMQKGE